MEPAVDYTHLSPEEIARLRQENRTLREIARRVSEFWTGTWAVNKEGESPQRDAYMDETHRMIAELGCQTDD